MELKYIARGAVVGYMWGGGVGAYPSETIEADSEKELFEKIEEALNNGSLDSGFGFERLKGALMDIRVVTHIQINGKDFKNVETEMKVFGELTEKEQDVAFLALFD